MLNTSYPSTSIYLIILNITMKRFVFRLYFTLYKLKVLSRLSP